MFHGKRVIMKLIYVLVLIFIENLVNCNEDEDVKSKKPLPFFRRQVEEITGDMTFKTQTDDAQSRLVSFLVKNVKKIFSDADDHTPNIENAVVFHEPTVMYSLTRTAVGKPNKSPPYIILPTRLSLRTTTDGVLLYENLTLSFLPHLIDLKSIKANPTQLSVDAEFQREHETNELLHLTKNLQQMQNEEKEQKHLTILNNSIKSPYIFVNDTGVLETISPARSCIFCNNVAVPACSNPKNKLIPSTVCKSTEELCYSMHTPFGIVERGCFSVNNNLTVYVCSCNLCNYISISDMPQMFTRKQDWIDNVIELSRTRRLKKSVFKEMSCLLCEVNATANQDRDMLSDSNCLEGNIGFLPSQECKDNEICAVTAHIGQGYIWRGCVNFPLYNYYLTLCDSDLCNYDDIVSVFDGRY